MNQTAEESPKFIWLYPPLSLLDVDSADYSVTLRSVLNDLANKGIKSKLTVALGRDMVGNSLFADISRMVHCLITGEGGVGKTTIIKTLISSLLFTTSPDEVKMILIDLKGSDLSVFQETPHLLTPIISEDYKILSGLKWVSAEMDRRFNLLPQYNARDIHSYNTIQGLQALPYIVIFLEELSEIKLMEYVYKDIEEILNHVSSRGPLVGIHLVATAKRPTRNLVALFPSRIAFKQASETDSHIILNKSGAEKLIVGDFLYLESRTQTPICVQGAITSQIELSRLKKYLTEDAMASNTEAETVNRVKDKIIKAGVQPDEYEEFLDSNSEIIDKFCDIAARKVSVVDEYGEENWAILESEKQRCFVKIATKLGLSEKFLDSIFLKLEDNEVEGHGQNNAVSYLGQNLRVALANIDSEIIHYSFFLVNLYFIDLEKIFKEKYRNYKPRIEKDTDYANVTGIDFEVLVGKKLMEAGYTISGTPKTGDQGADVIATKDGKKYIIQAKKYTGLVGNKAVQEVVAAKSYYKGDFAIVVTNSKYTPAAKDLAQKSDVMLIDGDSLENLSKL